MFTLSHDFLLLRWRDFARAARDRAPSFNSQQNPPWLPPPAIPWSELRVKRMAARCDRLTHMTTRPLRVIVKRKSVRGVMSECVLMHIETCRDGICGIVIHDRIPF